MFVLRYLIIFIIIVTGFVHPAISQEETGSRRNFIIQPRVHYGNVLPFYDAVRYLVHDHANGFELRFGLPSYGDDFWEKVYRYPLTGAGYSCWALGNSDVFGVAHALYGYFDAPLFRIYGPATFNYQVSFGASYLHKIFDVETNNLNRAIGSHINVYFRIGFDIQLKLCDRASLSLESGFSHFSNGKVKSPNYGLNAFTGSVGVNYLFGDPLKKLKEPALPPVNKLFSHSLVFAAGSKVYDNLIGTRYFLSSLSYNIDWNWKHKRKLGLGADLFYDASIAEALALDGVKNENEADFFRFGIHGSHTIRYKKMMMGMDIGHYIYSKFTDLSLVYSRLSLQYLFAGHYLVSVALKSHLAKADFIEWGIGYQW
ncbi:MAG: acyloxyacyl hydrolase [Bacteroidales bacterium]|nr:acyloxyacyl hydrolase [Bacteroidales bacterium]